MDKKQGISKFFKTTKRKWRVLSSYGEILDVAIQLKKEGEEVLLCVTDKDYEKIGEGIVEKTKDWHQCIGQGYYWLIDGCERADLSDWLRAQGEKVVGTNVEMAEYENDRQKRIFNQPCPRWNPGVAGPVQRVHAAAMGKSG